MSNVEATQQRDCADAEIIQQYTKLADRTASAEARLRALETELQTARTSSPQPEDKVKAKPSTPQRGAGSPLPQPAEIVGTAQLRQQLADAQRARSHLEAQIPQINTLQTSNSRLAQQLRANEREVSTLKRKLRDREEEIREKDKLKGSVQDEMISLNLQLSMAEQRAEKAEADNKGLVERWMKEMGERAERMNKGSGW